ncbi:MAG: response regulator [Deltaproteobacteria bacterium]|nr:response regulator [Deltaproteobacteria bacterium]
MKRILIVDDNEQNLYLLRTLLGGNGYEVVAASNGAEALDIAHTTPPDLIVSDVLMPVMDGFTLCRRWMADEGLRRIPFVFHTATYTDPKDERLALGLGAVRFIAKPGEPEAVVEALRVVLEHAAAGRLAPPSTPAPEETVYLKQYNEALVRKLEAKMLQLEEANRALAESNRVRLNLLESISDAFLAVDRHWRLTFLNKRAEQLLRRALPGQHDLVGTSLQQAFPELIPAIPELAEPTVPAQLPRAPLETFFAPTDGWFEIHAYRAGDGLSVFFHEITERKNEAQALRRLNDELEERVAQRTEQLELANKELVAFSYTVSHDLRAPLRAVSGLSAILLDEYAPMLATEADNLLRRIQSNTTHMEELIDALLWLSRVTRGELNVQQVDLGVLAGSIIEKLHKAQPERLVEIVIAPQVVVEGDAHLLRVALDNLLSNAWKFTAKHSSARIEFGMTRCDGQSVYFVRDDGAGFDPACSDRLFMAFERLHSFEDFEGTGIGLATVRRVIDRHGGRIWSESAVERGSTFFFTLGVSPAEAQH